uniref:Solute carrier family 13 member 5 n=1 Tax=Parasteatoda tepidariorum TaxID=114398 RepID=A0A2L2YCZ0_PARTP
MMIIGSLIMAVALEECRLHERIALKILMWVGSDIKWVMMGFMLTTMFLSMWVSNTATTALMVPIVDAILEKLQPLKQTNMHLKGLNLDCTSDPSLKEGKQNGEDEEEVADDKVHHLDESSTLKVTLLLSVCYSANIGGTGTLTGTAPNLVLKGLMDVLHPESNEITFASWMFYNIPGMLICVFIGWLYLWMVFIKFSKSNLNVSKEDIKDIISKRYADLGRLTIQEAQVMILFLILIFLWVFRDPKIISGWMDALGTKRKIGDSAPAMAIAFLLFFLPSDIRNPKSKKLFDWKTVQAKLPWGLILLLGGGFALADGAQKSGLSKIIGEKLASLQVLPPIAVVAVLCFMTTMITEIVSNTSTANILLPVFSQMALAIGVNPLSIMLPVSVVCSYAFMLPVATPPNAIAFDSGNMKTIQMAKPGIVMNIVCCAVQILMINTLGVALFDLNNFPSWANSTKTFDTTLLLTFNASLNTSSTL